MLILRETIEEQDLNPNVFQSDVSIFVKTHLLLGKEGSAMLLIIPHNFTHDSAVICAPQLIYKGDTGM